MRGTFLSGIVVVAGLYGASLVSGTVTSPIQPAIVALDDDNGPPTSPATAS